STLPLPTLCPTFSFSRYGTHRVLHSFPTRRSSDLRRVSRRHPGRPGGQGRRGERACDAAGRRAGTTLAHFRRSSRWPASALRGRSEEHTSELQSRENLVCRLLLEKKKKTKTHNNKT